MTGYHSGDSNVTGVRYSLGPPFICFLGDSDMHPVCTSLHERKMNLAVFPASSDEILGV